MHHVKQYIVFWLRMFRYAVTGGPLFYAWIGSLSIILIAGLYFYLHQMTHGLIVTNMSDQVSWGIGIANFTYFVGVAAAAVLLVVPSYIYHRQDVKEVVLIGELLAVCAVIMCLLFIVTDIGRPDRFLHLVPPLGRLNLPSSLLAWDVLVFNGYLFMNLHVPAYLLYKKYLGEEPKGAYYLPFVFISIIWAISIHTVTAFLFSGLGGRAFWNTAILAPRFLASAFASGPALLFIIFTVIRHYTSLKISESVFEYFKRVLKFMMPLNLFLLGCELFKELYTGTVHAHAAEYLYFGSHGHNMLIKYIWTATIFNIIATIIFITPQLNCKKPLIYVGCVLSAVGIWLEKGMGFVFPGFIPTPLGEFVEYSPNIDELVVCAAVMALGALLFTFMSRMAIAVHTGELAITAEAGERSAHRKK